SQRVPGQAYADGTHGAPRSRSAACRRFSLHHCKTYAIKILTQSGSHPQPVVLRCEELAKVASRAREDFLRLSAFGRLGLLGESLKQWLKRSGDSVAGHGRKDQGQWSAHL